MNLSTTTTARRKSVSVEEIPPATQLRAALNRVIEQHHYVVLHVSHTRHCECTPHDAYQRAPFAEDEVFQGPQGHLIISISKQLYTARRQEDLEAWAKKMSLRDENDTTPPEPLPDNFRFTRLQ